MSALARLSWSSWWFWICRDAVVSHPFFRNVSHQSPTNYKALWAAGILNHHQPQQQGLIKLRTVEKTPVGGRVPLWVFITPPPLRTNALHVRSLVGCLSMPGWVCLAQCAWHICSPCHAGERMLPMLRLCATIPDRDPLSSLRIDLPSEESDSHTQ